jgi:hypothetical protein
MRLRLIPVIITMFITTGVLFGGWYSFQHWGISMPIKDQVESLDGVTLIRHELREKELFLELEVAPDVRLREINEVLKEKLADDLNGRELVLQVEDRSSVALDRWWGEQLFVVAESMDLRKYAGIPSHLNKVSQQFADGKAIVEMDETNIYVQIYEGKHYKFVILPREAQLGVWNG